MKQREDSIAGVIMGCAVGDAIGLPYEGLSKRRGIRLLDQPDRHRFVAGRGMVSDDTEHTWMVAEALCAAPRDPNEFARQFGRRLRNWLFFLPAGIGLATLRATIKLSLGVAPSRSGVFSAGNGPAMRSAILGAALDDLDVLRTYVRRCTEITHTDPKAFHGALAVALAAWCARRCCDTPDTFFAQYRSMQRVNSDSEFDDLMTQVESSLASGESTEVFAEQIGCARGVSGYVYRTVPVVLHAWLRQPRDYQGAVTAVIRCGGDTDTTAAIVGSMVGAGLGPSGIPQPWLDGLWEWPRSVDRMRKLAAATAHAMETGASEISPKISAMAVLVRNAVFLGVVLGHVARRSLPPY